MSQGPPAFRILDHGQHFEPKGLWYENVEERVLRDIRKLLARLGGPNRRPVLRRWTDQDGTLRAVGEPLRHPGREWTWTELEAGVERFATTLPAGELACVLEKDADADRWSVRLGDTLMNEAGPDHVTPDGAVAIGPRRTLQLAEPVHPRIGSAGLELEPAQLVGGVPLPQGARVQTELIGLPDGPQVAPDELEKLVEPFVRFTSNLIGEDGPLATRWVPVNFVTNFTGASLDADRRRVRLDGDSIRPVRLALTLTHRLGEQTSTVRLGASRDGDAYLLDEPWTPTLPALGRVEIGLDGRTLGVEELGAPPLRARWIHPPGGGARPAPRLPHAASSLEVREGPALRWELQPDGRVRYTSTGQTAPLDDHDHEALAVDTPADLMAAVRTHGALEAWLPGQHHLTLGTLEDLEAMELLLRHVGRLGPIRLGRGRHRGVVGSLEGPEPALAELPAEGGRIHLPQATGQAVRVWYRGHVRRGRLTRLGESQVALEVDPIPTLDLVELGPYAPLRAWKTANGARLQSGGRELQLERAPAHVGLRWRGPGVLHRFDEEGYDVMLPVEPVESYAWNGCLFDGDLQFRGWLVRDGVLELPAQGPWAAVALVHGGPSRPELGVSHVLPGADLSAFPIAVRQGVEALLGGARIAPEVAIDTDDGRWILVPRHRHPRRPPEKVEVHPPGAPAAPGVPGLRVWVARG